ncbi:hypothetical protein ACS0VI_11220 [Streptomyces sp. H28]
MHNAQVHHSAPVPDVAGDPRRGESAPGRGLVVHTVNAFLCMTAGMSLCLSVVIRLGGR